MIAFASSCTVLSVFLLPLLTTGKSMTVERSDGRVGGGMTDYNATLIKCLVCGLPPAKIIIILL